MDDGQSSKTRSICLLRLIKFDQYYQSNLPSLPSNRFEFLTFDFFIITSSTKVVHPPPIYEGPSIQYKTTAACFLQEYLTSSLIQWYLTPMNFLNASICLVRFNATSLLAMLIAV